MIGKNRSKTPIKLVLPMVLAVFVSAGCGAEKEPATISPLPVSEENSDIQARDPAPVGCVAGDRRECHVVYDLASGAKFCATGAEVCLGDDWSSCMDVEDAVTLSADLVVELDALGGARGE